MQLLFSSKTYIVLSLILQIQNKKWNFSLEKYILILKVQIFKFLENEIFLKLLCLGKK